MLGTFVLALVLSHGAADSSQATQSTPPPQQPTVTGEAKPEQPWPPTGVSRLGAGIAAPEVIKEAKPSYTRDAMRAKIQGTVELDVIVHADGTVGEVRVRRSLDQKFGLDDEAIQAVKKWRFKPAKKGDVAVPVLVQIEMSFAVSSKR